MDKEEKRKAVSGLSLFQGLPESQAAALASLAEVRRPAKGATIFRAGDPALGFFAVIKGRVRIFRSAPSGKEHILHVFGPGEVFAEVAVFQGWPYPADAEALAEELVTLPLHPGLTDADVHYICDAVQANLPQ